MVAMSISVVVLLANIYLFNTAHRDLSVARSVTVATNLATDKVAEFRAMTIAQIAAAVPPVSPVPCPSSTRTNPLNRRQGSDISVRDGISFTRTWVVASVDLDHNGTPNNECDDSPDMCSELSNVASCDVVSVSLEVTWSLANKDHRVAMATFVTGKTS
jgi:hypothetical protein